ncbi:MAG TPA: hypothetical protein DCQ70_10835 [Halieaceae bacterium]|nr:hypothetical protein [Halieaceae bacterium]
MNRQQLRVFTANVPVKKRGRPRKDAPKNDTAWLVNQYS